MSDYATKVHIRMVAEIHGYSYQYVWMVVNGQRKDKHGFKKTLEYVRNGQKDLVAKLRRELRERNN